MLKAKPDDRREFVQTCFRAPCDSIYMYSIREHMQIGELYILNLDTKNKNKSLDWWHCHSNTDMQNGQDLFSTHHPGKNSVFSYR